MEIQELHVFGKHAVSAKWIIEKGGPTVERLAREGRKGYDPVKFRALAKEYETTPFKRPVRYELRAAAGGHFLRKGRLLRHREALKEGPKKVVEDASAPKKGMSATKKALIAAGVATATTGAALAYKKTRKKSRGSVKKAAETTDELLERARKEIAAHKSQKGKSDVAAKAVRGVLDDPHDAKIRKLKAEIASVNEAAAKKVRKLNRTSRRLGTASKVLTGTAAVLGLGIGAKKLYDSTREPTIKKKVKGTAKAGLEMGRDARDLHRAMS